MTVGATEVLIVLAVLLLLFGSTRLPKLARSIGEAGRELRKGMNEASTEEEPKPGA